MKEIICSIIISVCLFLVIGIIGGVENGAPLSNLLWCFPLLTLTGISVYILNK